MPMNPRTLRPYRKASAATSFSPASIPGLALWLDGSDSSTFTLNGSTISQWNDKSGNGRHFSQSTASLQPAPATSVKNGLGAVAFTSDWMSGEDTYDIGTLFLVWEQPSTASGDPYPGIFSARTSLSFKSNDGSLGLCFNAMDTNVDLLFADPWVTGSYVLNGSSASGAALPNYTLGGSAMRTSPDRWQYLSVVFNSPVSGLKPLVIGADTTIDTVSRAMQDGHIGEVIAYEGVLTPAQVAAVTDYLVTKWGLA